MLQSLNIKNFGLIDELNLDFHESLNVLTGQTGAGKSILLEGVRVALGGRFTAAQVRDLERPSIVEAVFDLTGTEMAQHPLLQEYFLDEEPQLILFRSFDHNGRSKIKVNGMTVPVSALKKIGALLLDFHGAHDHQMLLSEESHIVILDRLIDFKKSLIHYQNMYENYRKLLKEKQNLEDLTQNRERELDVLQHQVEELESIPLDEEHYQKIQEDYVKIHHSEKLVAHAHEIMAVLDDQPGSCLELIRKIFSPMRQLTETDEKTQELQNMLEQFQDMGNEISYQVREYMDGLNFNGQTATDIYDQVECYNNVFRKYGANINEIKTFYQDIRQKYDVLLHFDANQEELDKNIEDHVKQLTDFAKELTKKRKKAANVLKKTIEKELSELGIEHVQFEARFDVSDFKKNGYDQVIFYISPNAGEDLKPLSEIVSSGEAARVMLALKKALIKVDPVPVLIFDEIDAQIGGRLGKITGEKLRDIARFRQVLLITHLPQIASFANHHYKVVKTVNHQRTTTHCTLLDDDARIDELAHMMSGSTNSEISLAHAEDMLVQASSREVVSGKS